MSRDIWVAIAVVVVAVWLVTAIMGKALVDDLVDRGRWAQALRVWALFGPIAWPNPARHRLAILGYAGRMQEALELAERLRKSKFDSLTRTVLINTFITAGRYRSALEVAPRVEPPSGPLAGQSWYLDQVNLAEAEMNLGAWDAALGRLDSIGGRGKDLLGMVKTGESLNRAWLLARLGRDAEAGDALGQAVFESLPTIFRAEYHYTHAGVELAARNSEAALAAVQRGLDIAVRESSKRNGLFLRARVHAQAGRDSAALADFEAAAAAEYRSQGGDGLLAWGDLLLRLGRPAEAAVAWRLAVERDPESESAARAAQQLTAPA